jgi:hypothetical protein
MDKKSLPDHAIPREADAYIQSMTPLQKELHKMAQEKLGSSYFVERSKGFLAWNAAQKK